MLNLSNRNEPYFIAEIGINHNGDLEIAKKLIDAAHACDWECVKFQKRNPDISVPEAQKNIIKDTPWGKMAYIKYKHKIEFKKKEYSFIDEYCKLKPIDWSASVWDIDSLNFMSHYDLPFIKIPSAMITNKELIIESARTNIQLIISTGMSTIEEIDSAVELVIKHGRNPVILHSVSSYPSFQEELNLNTILFLKERYSGCIIGYSGHEMSLEPSVVAVALGAKVIERHVTLSHSMWGTDQSTSLEVHAMDMLKKRTVGMNEMMGIKDKVLSKSELKKRKMLRGY